MLRIRVFRAIDDLESCKRFAEGHANVLRDYGVTKVTSSKNDWFYNPDVYVAIVETENGDEVVGGERIHMVNKQFPLPIEEAIAIVEKKIYDLVARYADNKRTGELCGLWNAKAIAGRGVSILLTKLGVALAHRLRMDSLFVLCAPYTVSMCQAAGFEIETSIGNNGTFIYPKLDLVATSLVVKDMEHLSTADARFRKEILSYIENPASKTLVLGEKGETEVTYNILLPNTENQ
ncbi:MAG TPA: hypothetical protein VIN07_14470 [Flavipsychrobacter sp.]